MHWPRLATVVSLVATFIVAGCAPGASPSVSGSTSASASGSASASASVVASASAPAVPLTVGLGFIPSVQFAPFYLAQDAGYYAAEGLVVTFQNKIDPDLIALVGQGSIDLGMADGTSVIPAVSQGIPVRYLATVYGRFPSIVFAKASSGIDEPIDLKGRRLGIPGRYGSSWIMLQALLDSVGLRPEDLTINEYPDFGQGAAVTQGAVDAATGFVNNEPVQLELSGEPASVLRVDDVVALPGPGLIAANATIEAKREAIAGFVRATLRAMADIAADPARGLDASIRAVPELAQNRAVQAAILEATIATWRGPIQDAGGFGAIDPDGWQTSVDFMAELGLVPNPVTLDGLVTEEFVAGS